MEGLLSTGPTPSSLSISHPQHFGIWVNLHWRDCQKATAASWLSAAAALLDRLGNGQNRSHFSSSSNAWLNKHWRPDSLREGDFTPVYGARTPPRLLSSRAEESQHLAVQTLAHWQRRLLGSLNWHSSLWEPYFCRTF